MPFFRYYVWKNTFIESDLFLIFSWIQTKILRLLNKDNKPMW